MEGLKQSGRLVLDGDLTGRPVINTSTSYPGVADSYMGDGLHLGYEAAMVSMYSPTYGRFWLSVVNHSGSNVSSKQAEALVQAAETRKGMRPMRRADLLSKHICALEWKTSNSRLRLRRARESWTTFRPIAWRLRPRLLANRNRCRI